MIRNVWKFITSIVTTGALSPCWDSSIEAMLYNIDRSTTLTIVEYGPGLGGFTRYLLDKSAAEATLTCFEINEQDFGSELASITDPRLRIHYASCEDVGKFFEKNSVDLIVSTVPLSLIGKAKSSDIIQQSYEVLKPGGMLITGQYRSFARPLLTNIFGHVEHSRHLHNLPPLQIMKVIK